MAERLSPDLEAQIQSLTEQGVSRRAVADQVGVSKRTVQNVLKRLAAQDQAAVMLPARSARRKTRRELAADLAHLRDCCVSLADTCTQRVAQGLERHMPVRDEVTSMAILIDKIVAAQAHLELVNAMPARLPRSDDERTAVYLRLLWLLASRGGQGAVPAARQLGVELGVAGRAGKRPIALFFEDDDDADSDQPGEAPPTSEAPSPQPG